MIRGSRFLLHVLTGVFLSFFVILPVLSLDKKNGIAVQQRLTRWWFRHCTDILHLRIVVSGTPTTETAIFVANHISWIDIFVLGQLVAVNFVSKAEVKQWFIGGWLAHIAGTLFIQRGSLDSTAHIQSQMQARLQQQRSICFFPEGTSTEGDGVKAFRRRLFQVALNIGLPVQAVALCYPRNNQPNRVIAYVDEDTLPSNLSRLLAEKETRVEVQFCPLLDSCRYADAADLAKAAWLQVQTHIERRYQ